MVLPHYFGQWLIQQLYTVQAVIGKNPKFCVPVRFCSGCEYLKKLGSCSIQVLNGYRRFHSVKEPSIGTMTFGFGVCSVLGKTWVPVRFVLAGFGFFPISRI